MKQLGFVLVDDWHKVDVTKRIATYSIVRLSRFRSITRCRSIFSSRAKKHYARCNEQRAKVSLQDACFMEVFGMQQTKVKGKLVLFLNVL